MLRRTCLPRRRIGNRNSVAHRPEQERASGSAPSGPWRALLTHSQRKCLLAVLVLAEARLARRLSGPHQESRRAGNHWRPSSAALQRRISSPLSVTQLVKLTRRLQSLRGGGRHDQRTRRFPGEALVIVANDPLAGKFDIAYIATAASETSSLKPSLTRAQRSHAGHEASPRP